MTAWARVDLGTLAANYRAIAAATSVPLMPVVKADAYGHGAIPVARRLVEAGATMLAVAYVQEGVALRGAGVDVPIVVLTGCSTQDAPVAAEAGLALVVSSPTTLAGALAAGRAGGQPKSVHVKVDTGMGRLGFTTARALEAAQELQASGVAEVEGLMTHLACADEDAEFTRVQLDRFDAAVADLARAGLKPRWIHACNSAGLAFLRPTHTLARPGLLLYGIRPRPLSPEIAVRPVMTVTARVALVKDVPTGTPISYGARWVAPRPSRIATLHIGYADGVPRTDAMREKGAFNIAGRRVRVRGTVCMDLTMVDVTDRPDVVEGAEATLVGADPGAWDLAGWAGTNAWQVLTAIGPRVPRVYPEDGRS